MTGPTSVFRRLEPDRHAPLVDVGDLRLSEAAASAEIHRAVLGTEFLARFGLGFLTAYHRAWIRSPQGLALAARDHDGRLVGVLLGTLDPASHYRGMLRRAGAGLAIRLAGRALLDPVLARDLIVTRAARYTRGVWRNLTGRQGPDRPAGDPAATTSGTGEITHLMVSPAGRGCGAGRALVAEAERRGRARQVGELTLVTPPDSDAIGFYLRLGWAAEGALTSRSGEAFIRFRRRL